MWTKIHEGWVKPVDKGFEVVIVEEDTDHLGKNIIRKQQFIWENQCQHLESIDDVKSRLFASYLLHFGEEKALLANDMELAYISVFLDFECEYFENLNISETKRILKNLKIFDHTL